jgi:hypothetical protein
MADGTQNADSLSLAEPATTEFVTPADAVQSGLPITFLIMHPATCFIVGATQAGKTSNLMLLLEKNPLSNPDGSEKRIDHVYLVKGREQDAYSVTLPSVCKRLGAELSILDNYPPGIENLMDPAKTNVMIMDDASETDVASVTSLFTGKYRTLNCTVFLIRQMPYVNSKNIRNNSNYFGICHITQATTLKIFLANLFGTLVRNSIMKYLEGHTICWVDAHIGRIPKNIGLYGENFELIEPPIPRQET